MYKYLKTIGVIALTFLIAVGCSTEKPGSNNANNDDEPKDDIKIGLSISTLDNPFFVTLRDGAEAAAEKEDFEVISSDAQDDSSTQLDDVEDMIQQDIDILLINPADSDAVVSAIELANDEDIPVITVDRESEGGDVVTHIASDNVEGGEMAAEYIDEELDGKGNLVELEGVSGASATRERGEGFHNVIDDNDDFDLVSQQSADFDRTEGLSVMENILQSDDDIDAVFAHNDEMALGAVEALESKDMLDDVTIVGFDATDDGQEAVEDGKMDASIAQQPELIGETSIEEAEKVVNGEEVDDFIPVDLEMLDE